MRILFSFLFIIISSEANLDENLIKEFQDLSTKFEYSIKNIQQESAKKREDPTYIKISVFDTPKVSPESYQKVLQESNEFFLEKDTRKALESAKKALWVSRQVFKEESLETLVAYREVAYYLTFNNSIAGTNTRYKEPNASESPMHFEEKALAISKKLFGDNDIRTIIAYANMSFFYLKEESLTVSLSYLEQALRFSKKSNIENLERANFYSKISQIYEGLSQFLVHERYIKNALFYAKESLRISKKNNLQNPQKYFDISNIYLKMKHYSKALDFSKQGLALLKENIAFSEVEKASYYHSLSKNYKSLEQYSKAFELLDKSLSIYKKRHFAKNDDGYYGYLYKEIYHSNFEAMLNPSEIAPVFIELYADMASIYALQNNFPLALSYYKKAIKCKHDDILDEEQKREFNAELYHDISKVYYGLKNYALAYAYEHKASNLFLELRDLSFKHLTNREKTYFLHKKAYTLEYLLDITFEAKENKSKNYQKNIEDSFALWLSLKGEISHKERNFMALKTSTKDETLKKKIDLFFEKKRILSQLFIEQISSPEDFSEQKQEQIKELEKDKNQIEIYLNGFQDYKYSTFNIDVLNTNRYIEEFSDVLYANELYLDFVKTKKHYYVFTFDKKRQLNFYRLTKSRSDIDDAIRVYRQSIMKKERTIEETKLLASNLYRTIFDKIKIDYSSLVISPDGIVNLLPFEALVSPTKNYLIEEKNIAYIASGKDLYIARYHRKNRHGKSKEVIVLSYLDYTYDEDTSKTKKPKENRDLDDLIAEASFDKLNETKNEAPKIKEIFQSNKISAYTNKEGIAELAYSSTFQENQVLAYTNKEGTKALLYSLDFPQILHLSTHSVYAKDNNSTVNSLLKSALALSEYDAIYTNGDNRGLMTALEFSTLNLFDTELVFFASCQSGLGDIQSSEGVSGLNRGAKMAGAQKVISTLWSVADKESVMLVEKFYRNLIKTSSKNSLKKFQYIQALRSTKLEMLNLHPYYWAGFIQYGLDYICDED